MAGETSMHGFVFMHPLFSPPGPGASTGARLARSNYALAFGGDR